MVDKAGRASEVEALDVVSSIFFGFIEVVQGEYVRRCFLLDGILVLFDGFEGYQLAEIHINKLPLADWYGRANSKAALLGHKDL